MIGFHDFTGNDYVSSFFLKGQKRYWEVAIKSLLLLVAFAALGNDWKFEEKVISTLEQYVCCIFGSKRKSFDVIWADLFMKKKWKQSNWLIKYPSLFTASRACKLCCKNLEAYFMYHFVPCPFLISLVTELNRYNNHILMTSLNC